ncbi:trypsin-like peptidase [Saccharothrix carnea]|uniref:Trypsin-like peptidase n=1 Tax=Saccharothrix carnea TaxID=1280637 RepID=A0A2P8I110_SACCR|nr:trypsin-like peptidase domain-containing protein [Saccharothrix carnea]PSL52156.1 trypsin-like peptidase [Saccharothrix carnea]
MNEMLHRAVVRIRDEDEVVHGVGFLVAPDIVLTCAHIVERSVPAILDFPLVPDRGEHRAEVERSRPDLDVALLRLPGPVTGTGPVPVVSSSDDWGHTARLFGFPRNNDNGVWMAARALDRQGSGWVQLEADQVGRRFERGFSGSPVWDDQARAVTGMVVAVQERSTTAYLVPVSALVEDLSEFLPNPFRGLAPFEAEHAALFRGRDEEVAELVAAVDRRRLVVVTGPSGVGKSSLVRAGLLPTLSTNAVTLRPVRGQDPAGMLASALVPVLEPGLGRIDQLERERKLAGLLTPQVLGSFDVLVFLDQFEELADTDPDQAAELLRWTAETRTVATLRPGALERLLTKEIGHGLVPVAPMGPEQLRAAISSVPGTRFETGLIDLVLRDAGAEPGALPLVQFALSLMWEKRRGALSIEGYREIGEIGGALSKYADEVWEGLFADDGHARDLLVQLARPDTDGRFTRKPVLLDALPPEQARAAKQLTATRLVVTGSTASHEPIVDLAHQALIDRWEQLRTWLAEARQFREWQEELDRRALQWRQSKEKDDGSLLRGVALAQAEMHGTDRLTAEQRRYLAASREYQQRVLRRLWAVAAVMLVLVFLTGVLAVSTATNENRLDAQLATANARSLAAEADTAMVDDPARALRLAIAAYRTDPSVPETRNALMRQYSAWHSADKVFSEFDLQPVQQVLTSEDGDRALYPGFTGRVVATGIHGNALTKRTLDDAPTASGQVPSGYRYAVSPDGRWVALGSPVVLRLWDLRGDGAPVTLHSNLSARGPGLVSTSDVAFTADSSRLVWTGVEGDVEIWDVEKRVQVPHRVGGADTTAAWVVDDKAVLADRRAGVVVRELTTGAEVRVLPAGGVVARHGRDYVMCADDVVRVLDTTTGAERHRFTAACGHVRLDANRTAAVVRTSTARGADHTWLRVLDLADGSTRAFATPPLPAPASTTPLSDLIDVAVVRRAPGRVGAVLVRGRSLLRFDDLPPNPGEGPVHHLALSGAGTEVVGTDGGDVVVAELRSRHQLARLPASSLPAGHRIESVGLRDGVLGVSTRTDRGLTISLFRYPTLEPRGRFNVPVRVRSAAAEAPYAAYFDSDRLAVLYQGVLTGWWLDDKPAEPRKSRVVEIVPEWDAWIYHVPMLAGRPGHGNEVFVALPGHVQVYDPLTGRSTGPKGTAGVDRPRGFVFDATGDTLAMLVGQGQVQLWRLAEHMPSPPLPTTEVTNLVGFTPDGALVTVEGGNDGPTGLRFWDVANRRATADLALGGAFARIAVTGSSLVMVDQAGTLEIPLDPRAWEARLCGLASRFTADEIDRLFEGKVVSPLC